MLPNSCGFHDRYLMISESEMSMMAYMIHMWATADFFFFSSRIHQIHF